MSSAGSIQFLGQDHDCDEWPLRLIGVTIAVAMATKADILLVLCNLRFPFYQHIKALYNMSVRMYF